MFQCGLSTHSNLVSITRIMMIIYATNLGSQVVNETLQVSDVLGVRQEEGVFDGHVTQVLLQAGGVVRAEQTIRVLNRIILPLITVHFFNLQIILVFHVFIIRLVDMLHWRLFFKLQNHFLMLLGLNVILIGFGILEVLATSHTVVIDNFLLSNLSLSLVSYSSLLKCFI